MVVAAFFAWPMVHNWFVSMGMLDFALAVPLATLPARRSSNAQRQRPTFGRGVGLGGARRPHAGMRTSSRCSSCICSLAPSTSSLRGTWRERRRCIGAARLSCRSSRPRRSSRASLRIHSTEPVGAMTGYVDLGRPLPPWELFYNLWAEWFCTASLARDRDARAVHRHGPLGHLQLARRRPVLRARRASSRSRRSTSSRRTWRPTGFTSTRASSRFSGWPRSCACRSELPAGPRRSSPRARRRTRVGMGVDYVRLAREWARFTAGDRAPCPRARSSCRSSSAARGPARTRAACSTRGASTSSRS